MKFINSIRFFFLSDYILIDAYHLYKIRAPNFEVSFLFLVNVYFSLVIVDSQTVFQIW